MEDGDHEKVGGYHDVHREIPGRVRVSVTSTDWSGVGGTSVGGTGVGGTGVGGTV